MQILEVLIIYILWRTRRSKRWSNLPNSTESASMSVKACSLTLQLYLCYLLPRGEGWGANSSSCWYVQFRGSPKFDLSFCTQPYHESYVKCFSNEVHLFFPLPKCVVPVPCSHWTPVLTPEMPSVVSFPIKPIYPLWTVQSPSFMTSVSVTLSDTLLGFPQHSLLPPYLVILFSSGFMFVFYFCTKTAKPAGGEKVICVFVSWHSSKPSSIHRHTNTCVEYTLGKLNKSSFLFGPAPRATCLQADSTFTKESPNIITIKKTVIRHCFYF